MEKISRNVAAFIAALFIILSLELITDFRTYVNPPSFSEAHLMVNEWTHLGLGATGGRAVVTEGGERRLMEFMTSGYRYYVHRVMLGSLLFCYLFCAWGIWRRRKDMTLWILFTFLLKCVHAAFFLWAAYLGRKNMALFFGVPHVPLMIFGDNEMHYLLGFAMAVLCMVYFTRFPVHNLPVRINERVRPRH